MSMSDEKLQKFEAAVTKEARAQAQKLVDEVREKKQLELSKINDAELEKYFTEMQKEISKIKQSCIKRVSVQSQATKKEILLAREEIKKKVFENLFKRLCEFSKSDEYENYLKKVYSKLTQFQTDDLVVFVAPKDLELAKKVFEPREVKPDSKIEIGGFILKSESWGFAVDETLDTQLEEQNEYFNAISNLTI